MSVVKRLMEAEEALLGQRIKKANLLSQEPYIELENGTTLYLDEKLRYLPELQNKVKKQ